MARTNMSDDNAILENYLKGGTRLSDLYSQQCNELPSEAIDNAILAAARREAGSGPGNRHIRKWQVPASMAAGLVFAIGMVAMLNQRLNNHDTDQGVAQVAMSSIEKSAQSQPERKTAQSAELSEMDAREQTLARAAAGADEQAVSVARQSMASVAAGPEAGRSAINVSKLSFAERFSLLKPGLKPAQIAVLLGEPSSKQPDQWTYRRLTNVPGKSVEYHVRFNESSELTAWDIKQLQE